MDSLATKKGDNLATKNNPTEGWTLVTRRRRPPHFSPSPHSPPRQTKVLDRRSPSYAQVLRSPPKPPPVMLTKTNEAPVTRNSPPSPNSLPFPPNPHHKEWWGRCFRCAQKGHVVAECKQPRVFGTDSRKAARQTSTHSKTLTMTSQAITPRIASSSEKGRHEPSFEEFLAQPEPLEAPIMPKFRPAKVNCYFSRDDQYYRTLKKLESGVVVQPPENRTGQVSLDHIATMVAASKKVHPDHLQVAILSNNKFLVVLPASVERMEVVTAIPIKFWNEGYQFHSYSPLMDATVSIPFFKLWIDIIGVPLELHTEVHMATAVSSFGTYLGSMEPAVIGDCQTWTVFVATDDLALVPCEIDMRVGGMVHTAKIKPRKWIKGQVLNTSDLPPPPIPYRPPSELPPPTDAHVSNTEEQAWPEDEEVILMSLKALREIFRNTPPAEVPSELVAPLLGDRQAITANQAAYRRWERENEKWRMAQRDITQRPTGTTASQDPPHMQLMPRASLPSEQEPFATEPLPTPHSSHALLHSPQTSLHISTVHRTAEHAPRGKRTQDDMAIEVCNESFSSVGEQNNFSWEPHVLFPEICAPISQQGIRPHARKVIRGKRTTLNKVVNTELPRRSGRNKNSRISYGEKGLNINIQEFVDVPLQHAEGTEVLALIGANNITIPPHLMSPSQQQMVNLETGQSSKAQPKRKKQNGQEAHPGQQDLHTQQTMRAEVQQGLQAQQDMQASNLPQGVHDENNMVLDLPALPDQGIDQATMDDTVASQDNHEDPYLDRVDYSGDELDY